jgi:hypothetical protein
MATISPFIPVLVRNKTYSILESPHLFGFVQDRPKLPHQREGVLMVDLVSIISPKFCPKILNMIEKAAAYYPL